MPRKVNMIYAALVVFNLILEFCKYEFNGETSIHRKPEFEFTLNNILVDENIFLQMQFSNN